MTSFAASTITISSSGNGGFLLQGSGMENVAAMDIVVTYDTAALASPQVAKGGLISNAMMAINLNVPGSVRLGIITISPVNGDGTIASLTFVKTSASPGRILSLSAIISNSGGKPLLVNKQIVNPPGVPDSGPASTTETGAAAGTTPPAVLVTPGVGVPVVTGADAEKKEEPEKEAKEELQDDPDAEPEPEEEIEEITEETVSKTTGTEQLVERVARKKQSYTQKSVLELFRKYDGKESVKAFVGLFDQEPLIGFNQKPPIALSGGKSTISISFIAMPSGKKDPEIEVKGAVLVGSLKKDTDNTNTWIATLKPDKKAVSASLDVNQEKVIMEFPIAVAPGVNIDLDRSGAVTEADFTLFLRVRGNVRKPRFDLNKDGKRDFEDSYIFTANYIVKKASEKKASEKKVPAVRSKSKGKPLKKEVR